ncbi:MAG: thiamine phosphate synthase [Dehalococcoidales bacterium]|nr:thiamine phosphate synthase [Dehalococcoidales bacterium]
MSTLPVTRIIDANLNRLAEGLRILEEISRMILNDTGMTQKLKTLRHDLVRGDLSFNLELLRSRNSTRDVGSSLEVEGEEKKKDLPLIVIANSRRAQESLRVLEELAKLPEVPGKLDSDSFKKARFALYTLEQELIYRLLRQDKAKSISGLYVIIDTGFLKGRGYREAAEQVIQSGARVIRFCDKILEKKQLLAAAGELRGLCRQKGVLFIINEYLDIALAAEADGLHIGREGLPVEVARRLLPADKILGCTASTVEEAAAAEAAGADYIAVGAVYPGLSENAQKVVGLEGVRQVRRATKFPLVATGGIDETNTRAVLEAGADSIGLMSALSDAPDITRAARAIVEIIEAKK